jgi:hypothetical protein
MRSWPWLWRKRARHAALYMAWIVPVMPLIRRMEKPDP